MKAILILTLIVTVLAAACIGCLVIVGLYPAESAPNLLLKVTAITLLIGFASAVVAFFTRDRKSKTP